GRRHRSLGRDQPVRAGAIVFRAAGGSALVGNSGRSLRRDFATLSAGIVCAGRMRRGLVVRAAGTLPVDPLSAPPSPSGTGTRAHRKSHRLVSPPAAPTAVHAADARGGPSCRGYGARRTGEGGLR